MFDLVVRFGLRPDSEDDSANPRGGGLHTAVPMPSSTRA